MGQSQNLSRRINELTGSYSGPEVRLWEVRDSARCLSRRQAYPEVIERISEMHAEILRLMRGYCGLARGVLASGPG
jgi:hypothetical protein